MGKRAKGGLEPIGAVCQTNVAMPTATVRGRGLAESSRPLTDSRGSTGIDQRPDQIRRPDETDRGTCQRFEGGVAPIGQIDHMMAEMSEHSREIETGSPLPDMLILARAGGLLRLRRSKGKDSASKLRQSWGADHDIHPHACSVTVNNMRDPTTATLYTIRNSCAEGRRGAQIIPGLPGAVTLSPRAKFIICIVHRTRVR